MMQRSAGGFALLLAARLAWAWAEAEDMIQMAIDVPPQVGMLIEQPGFLPRSSGCALRLFARLLWRPGLFPLLLFSLIFPYISAIIICIMYEKTRRATASFSGRYGGSAAPANQPRGAYDGQVYRA